MRVCRPLAPNIVTAGQLQERIEIRANRREEEEEEEETRGRIFFLHVISFPRTRLITGCKKKKNKKKTLDFSLLMKKERLSFKLAAKW